MEKNVRLRLLLVMELLFEQTDFDHGVSMQNIISWLNLNEIAGERKSIYEDIHALQEYGLSIEYYNEDKTYRLVERSIELAELKLIVDAIHASKFITKQRSKKMIEDIMDMSSCYQRGALQREIFVEKPKSQNPVGFYSMDFLHEAMTQNCEVSFQYSIWNLDKKLEYKHDGKLYRVSPWLLVWAEENYYLVAYDSIKEMFKHFRVDKISHVEILDSQREGEEEFGKLDTTNYSTNHFGMYSGDTRRVTIQFANELIGVILDRFGTDLHIMKVDSKCFKVSLPIVVSNQFFGWLFALGNQAKILTKEVAIEYCNYLEMTRKSYTE